MVIPRSRSWQTRFSWLDVPKVAKPAPWRSGKLCLAGQRYVLRSISTVQRASKFCRHKISTSSSAVLLPYYGAAATAQRPVLPYALRRDKQEVLRRVAEANRFVVEGRRSIDSQRTIERLGDWRSIRANNPLFSRERRSPKRPEKTASSAQKNPCSPRASAPSCRRNSATISNQQVADFGRASLTAFRT